jgi:hypothetical protein
MIPRKYVYTTIIDRPLERYQMYPLPLPRLWEGIFTPNARCINTQGKGHEESHISDTSYTPYPLSHLLPQVHLTAYLLADHRYEKLTNFGSLGLPSGPISFFLKRSWT